MKRGITYMTEDNLKDQHEKLADHEKEAAEKHAKEAGHHEEKARE